MNKNVEKFLLKNKMHYKTIDVNFHKLDFISQMKAGLSGEKSSLQMIPTYISIKDNLQENEEVIVIDAGGTNLRIGTMRVINGSPVLEDFNKYPMPGGKEIITADEFYNKLVDYLEPVVDKSDKIGFCFSYPVLILPNCDGKILHLSKEIRIKGAIGSILGESLNKVLRSRGKKEKRIVILNDTIATLLGGMADNRKECESYIGYILGTGTNTSYIEACANILKVPEITSSPGQMAINIESGNYDGFKQGTFDLELDKSSKEPGYYKAEKMTSGAYQGNVIYRTVKGAAHDGMFSKEMTERFKEHSDFKLSDISDFCIDTNGNNKLSELTQTALDKEILYEIIDASFERSALITTTVFAALLEHTDVGKDPEKPVCISAEGTTFTKSTLFRPKLDKYMKEYIHDTQHRHFDVITVEDSSLKGAGIATLMTDTP